MNKVTIFKYEENKLMPYAAKNNGLFEVKEGKGRHNDWAGTQTLITPKGRETFRLLCKEPPVLPQSPKWSEISGRKIGRF